MFEPRSLTMMRVRLEGDGVARRRDQLLEHAAQLLDLDVLHLEQPGHHLLVERVRLVRVEDGGNGELLGPLLVDDLQELAVLVDGEAVGVERGEERGVELRRASTSTLPFSGPMMEILPRTFSGRMKVLQVTSDTVCTSFSSSTLSK